MALVAQINLFCSETDVQNLLSTSGEFSRLDDDGTGTVTTGTAGWQQAANYATARVKAYVQPRYSEVTAAGSWILNWWATVIAADMLCRRRGNPVPDSIRELLYGDGEGNRGVMGELRDVQAGRFKLPDAATRNVEWPRWSNVRVDPSYRLRQIRVERPISEPTPTQYAQNIDLYAEWAFETP